MTKLDLSYCQITDGGLQSLQNLKQLTKLDLSYCQITDEGLQSLQNLKQLTDLNLLKCAITGDGLQYLQNLKQLTKLDLFGCNINNEGLQYLQNLKQLTNLDLSYCTNITGEGLQYLQNLKQLTNLDLLQCGVIKDNHLQHLKHVRAISFRPVDWGANTCEYITDDGLSRLTHLTDLYLSGCGNFTGEGFQHLSNLTKLSLFWEGVDSRFDSDYFQYLSQLRHINLCGDLYLEDEDFKHLKNLQSAILQILSIRDKAISYLTQSGNLKTIVLDSMHNLTKESLTYLKDAKSVTSVTIEGICEGFTDEAVEELRKSGVSVKVI